jgi:hypothetical protein
VAYIPLAILGLVLIGLVGALAYGALRYRPRAANLPPFPGTRRAP